MNIITENLHCIGVVGRERATREGFKTRRILVDVNGVTENCNVCESLKTRILMNMQIIVNARERNTKHIPEGTLMNLAK